MSPYLPISRYLPHACRRAGRRLGIGIGIGIGIGVRCGCSAGVGAVAWKACMELGSEVSGSERSTKESNVARAAHIDMRTPPSRPGRARAAG